MIFNRRLLSILLFPGLALALWLVLAALLMVTFGVKVQAPAGSFEAVVALMVAMWLAATAAGAWLLMRLWRQYVLGPARLLNAARIMTSDLSATELREYGAATSLMRLLATEFENLAAQREELRLEMAQLVDNATRSVSDQRDQLAALMAELDHAVIVCNRDGQVLLYNARARSLVSPEGKPEGAALLGLGRPVSAIIDQAVIDHALETVEGRLARGVSPGAAITQFVTLAETGQMLRVSMSPVRPVAESGEAQLSGFVLLIDDISADHEQHSRRDSAMMALVEANHELVRTLRQIETLPPEAGLRLDEFEPRLDMLADDARRSLISRWPLSDMLGEDLIAAARRRLGNSTGAPIATAEVPDDLWLRVDSFGLLYMLGELAAGVRWHHPDASLSLTLTQSGAHAHIDLGWSGATKASDQLAALLDHTMAGGHNTGASPREIVERHGGEIWLNQSGSSLGGGEQRSFIRVLLPLAAVDTAPVSAQIGSRPEFYDFDLFTSGAGSAADDAPLSNLTFTVFDCETTGLDPAGGDEIIQIGGVRIVNSRILKGETFDQLVDPQRSIPEAGIAIHNIQPHMVRGQPTILQALPRFHRFAEGSVLVGHNIAFDMRFIGMKERATGCVFDHPVLDTLLLSSIVHPAEESHSLEAIAARLGITIGGRHTALGDALATAEVFAKLMPLLARHGIVTLEQAREASSRSQFARLRY